MQKMRKTDEILAAQAERQSELLAEHRGKPIAFPAGVFILQSNLMTQLDAHSRKMSAKLDISTRRLEGRMKTQSWRLATSAKLRSPVPGCISRC